MTWICDRKPTTSYSLKIPFVLYRSKALPRSRSWEFIISMPQCNTYRILASPRTALLSFSYHTTTPAKTVNILFIPFTNTVDGEMYVACVSGLLLMTGTNDIIVWADLLYRNITELTFHRKVPFLLKKNNIFQVLNCTCTCVTWEQYRLSRTDFTLTEWNAHNNVVPISQNLKVW